MFFKYDQMRNVIFENDLHTSNVKMDHLFLSILLIK